MNEFGAQCCICGNNIADTMEEPVEVTFSFKDGALQSTWAHIDCIGNCLHKSVPWLSLKDWQDDH